MSDDYDSYIQMINDRRINNYDSKLSISLPNDNSSKAKILKEVLAVIEREDEAIVRQDMITYKFRFNCMTQAMSIILGLIMFINSIIFLALPNSVIGLYDISMIMFAEAGVMFVLSALMVHRKSMTKPKTFRYKEIDSKIRDLRYAFVHSYTWLFTALCMVVFSTIFYYHF